MQLPADRVPLMEVKSKLTMSLLANVILERDMMALLIYIFSAPNSMWFAMNVVQF